MKIVLAPDSYKGSLTAKEVADAMAEGVRKVFPSADICKIPMADGGEGTVQSLVDATGGTFCTKMVKGPLGDPVQATYGILGDGITAVIEMAQASGLYLIDQHLCDPLRTSTFGTGQLILDALDRGCRKFLIGIGGSATNDGGAGMAQALGISLLAKNGSPIGSGGGSLSELDTIDMSTADPRLPESVFTVACDVDNPLCGPSGASAIFGPQKGATPEMVAILDANLAHLAVVIKRDLGTEVQHIPGAGAAGGLGAGLVAFVGAQLQKGVDIVVEATGLQEALVGADLVMTGEGRTDGQTVRGKTPFGVAVAAARLGVPVILISGSLGENIEELYEKGILSAFSILDRPMTVEEAMQQADQLVRSATERVLRLLQLHTWIQSSKSST